jgi:hypothetical protein
LMSWPTPVVVSAAAPGAVLAQQLPQRAGEKPIGLGHRGLYAATAASA